MEDNHVYGFSKPDALHVLQKLGIGGGGETGLSDRPNGPWLVIAKNGGSAIAARSGSTISSQSCTIQYVASGTISAASDTITVYNLSTTAVAADAYIVAAKASGVWIAVWEDC